MQQKSIPVRLPKNAVVTVLTAETRGNTLVVYSRLDIGRQTREIKRKKKRKRIKEAEVECWDEATGEYNDCEENETDTNDNLVDYIPDEEQANMMKLMGLPTSFTSNSWGSGKSKRRRRRRSKSNQKDASSNEVEQSETAASLDSDASDIEDAPSKRRKSITNDDTFCDPRFQGTHVVFDTEGENSGDNATLMDSLVEAEGENEGETTKQYESKDSYKEQSGSENEPPFGDENAKYWIQRYLLFSKFDEGCQLDKEGWYSVTPELIARHIAQKITRSLPPTPIILDGMCGPGGNTIQFASFMPIVFSVDIDPNKIRLAKHNAKIYGVDSHIEFIIGDFVKLAPKFRVDAVFLAPPWGGPGYINQEVFDLHSMKPDGLEIVRVAQRVTNKIAYMVPRNTNIDQLIEPAGSGSVEIEQNYINGKYKTLTAYYGFMNDDNCKQN